MPSSRSMAEGDHSLTTCMCTLHHPSMLCRRSSVLRSRQQKQQLCSCLSKTRAPLPAGSRRCSLTTPSKRPSMKHSRPAKRSVWAFRLSAELLIPCGSTKSGLALVVLCKESASSCSGLHSCTTWRQTVQARRHDGQQLPPALARGVLHAVAAAQVSGMHGPCSAASLSKVASCSPSHAAGPTRGP